MKSKNELPRCDELSSKNSCNEQCESTEETLSDCLSCFESVGASYKYLNEPTDAESSQGNYEMDSGNTIVDYGDEEVCNELSAEQNMKDYEANSLQNSNSIASSNSTHITEALESLNATSSHERGVELAENSTPAILFSEQYISNLYSSNEKLGSKVDKKVAGLPNSEKRPSFVELSSDDQKSKGPKIDLSYNNRECIDDPILSSFGFTKYLLSLPYYKDGLALLSHSSILCKNKVKLYADLCVQVARGVRNNYLMFRNLTYKTPGDFEVINEPKYDVPERNVSRKSLNVALHSPKYAIIRNTEVMLGVKTGNRMLRSLLNIIDKNQGNLKNCDVSGLAMRSPFREQDSHKKSNQICQINITDLIKQGETNEITPSKKSLSINDVRELDGLNYGFKDSAVFYDYKKLTRGEEQMQRTLKNVKKEKMKREFSWWIYSMFCC